MQVNFLPWLDKLFQRFLIARCHVSFDNKAFYLDHSVGDVVDHIGSLLHTPSDNGIEFSDDWAVERINKFLKNFSTLVGDTIKMNRRWQPIWTGERRRKIENFLVYSVFLFVFHATTCNRWRFFRYPSRPLGLGRDFPRQGSGFWANYFSVKWIGSSSGLCGKCNDFSLFSAVSTPLVVKQIRKAFQRKTGEKNNKLFFNRKSSRAHP